MKTHTFLRHLTATLPLSLAALSLPLLTAACAAPPSDEARGEDAEGEPVAAAEEALMPLVCVTVQEGTSDANLWEAAPTWNDGAAARISTGSSAEGGRRRSLLRFDLSGLPARIEVESASLSLRQLYREGGGTAVDVFQAGAPWEESSVTWGSFGDAFGAYPIARFFTVDSAAATHSVDVTWLARSWVDGYMPNRGLLLEEQGAGVTEFRSSESPYADERPRLDLCYRLPPLCGNGALDAGEECDDGDDNGVLRCDSDCTVRQVLKVAAGVYHGCAILRGGRVKCWGDNAYGQLGQGHTFDRGNGYCQMAGDLPDVELGAGRTAVDIAAGGYHTCALLDDGSLKCWGGNSHGELGIGDTSNRGDAEYEMGDNLPVVQLGSGRRAVRIDLGWSHSCAVLDDGAVKCWGYNGSGQLGLGDTLNRGGVPWQTGDGLPAVDLGAGEAAVAISAGAFHTCATLSDGAVKCWGYNGTGQLGLGDALNRGDAPGEMGDNLPALSLGAGAALEGISGGDNHTCALLAGGAVKCWGHNGHGQLGLGDALNRGDAPGEMGDSLPAVDLGAGAIAVEIGSGSYHSCARFGDGSVKCWGRNVEGQLGLGDTVMRGDGAGEMGDNLPAVNLGTGATAAMLATGGRHTCALYGDGGVRCWGTNADGQLGTGIDWSQGGGAGEMGDNLLVTRLFGAGW